MQDEPVSDTHFRFFVFYSMMRDLFSPPAETLAETGIKRGDTVLDFGCGRGAFSLAAAARVGPEGKVYALDTHPLAIEIVQKAAKRKGLTNVETIRSGGETGLAGAAVDVVLLYDIFHDLGEPEAILGELARVMKPRALLSVTDHHLKPDEIISGLRAGDFFQFSKKGKKTFEFVKNV